MVHGEFLNDQYNFGSLGTAMLTLLAAATGESWNGIMHDLMVRPNGTDWLTRATGSPPRLPTCALDVAVGTADCGTWLAVPYFISFQLVCFFLLLNAAIAVLLARFAAEAEPRFVPLRQYELFAAEWHKFDRLGSRILPATALTVIVRRMPAPLGVRGNRKKHALVHVLKSLSTGPNPLPLHHNGMMCFHEVLMHLAGRHFQSSKQGLGATRFAQQHKKEIDTAMALSTRTALVTRSIPNRPGLAAAQRRDSRSDAAAQATILEWYAALTLQSAYKGRLVRRRMQSGLKPTEARPAEPATSVARSVAKSDRKARTGIGRLVSLSNRSTPTSTPRHSPSPAPGPAPSGSSRGELGTQQQVVERKTPSERRMPAIEAAASQRDRQRQAAHTHNQRVIPEEDLAA